MADYAYQLKFVVAAPQDLEEIENILKETGAARSQVVLMPEGTDAETLRDRGRWLADICKRTRFRYGPRLHIDLYGNQRGV
jgi:7-carboxy-7-deazaguanine synthase